MSLGARIEERLNALGMSQAELARRANVPQTTMNGLIRGNSRTSPHLIQIALELQTTPAYLTGATDDPLAEFPDFTLTADERGWVEALRATSLEGRKALLSLSKLLVANERDASV